jgi:1-acyl-sn-glycerol-3-phosphate acyltransferase
VTLRLRWREQNASWLLLRVILGGPCRLLMRLRTVGAEHIPSHGGAILAGNHVSILDPIYVAIPPTDRGRTIRYVALASLWGPTPVGWLVRTLDQIPVRRGELNQADAIDELARHVGDGRLTGIFAEGRVGDGPLQRLKTGAARASLASNTPLIPVGVWGTQSRWPRKGLTLRRPWRPTVGIAFGPPFETHGDPLNPRDVERVTDQLASAIGVQMERAKLLARQ